LPEAERPVEVGVAVIEGREVAFPPSDFRLLRFWSDDYPPHERLAAWADVLSRMLLKVKVEPVTDIPFQVDAGLRALPDVHFGTGLFGPLIARRTPEIVAADDKDFYILINIDGPFRIRLPRTEFILDDGDAVFMSCAEEAYFIRPVPGRMTCARVNGTRLKSEIADAMDFSGQFIRRGNEPLRLFSTYLRGIDDQQGLTNAELRSLVTAHIFKLLALTLNSTRESVPVASSNAARLHTIKQFVLDNLADQELSTSRVAAASRMSARQVQRLFEFDDTTFSEFLLLQRLRSVHAALTDSRQAHRSISDIALASGFGDVSYFNRAFRNHYGASPTAIRRAAAAPVPSA
jgi:AraC-like DNA-binding protein